MIILGILFTKLIYLSKYKMKNFSKEYEHLLGQQRRGFEV